MPSSVRNLKVPFLSRGRGVMCEIIIHVDTMRIRIVTYFCDLKTMTL